MRRFTNPNKAGHHRVISQNSAGTKSGQFQRYILQIEMAVWSTVGRRLCNLDISPSTQPQQPSLQQGVERSLKERLSWSQSWFSARPKLLFDVELISWKPFDEFTFWRTTFNYGRCRPCFVDGRERGEAGIRWRPSVPVIIGMKWRKAFAAHFN